MEYERKGRDVEALKGYSELLGCSAQLLVQSPELNMVEHGRRQEVGVDPADAAPPERGTFYEPQHVRVLGDGGGIEQGEIGQHCGSARNAS